MQLKLIVCESIFENEYRGIIKFYYRCSYKCA